MPLTEVQNERLRTQLELYRLVAREEAVPNALLKKACTKNTNQDRNGASYNFDDVDDEDDDESDMDDDVIRRFSGRGANALALSRQRKHGLEILPSTVPKAVKLPVLIELRALRLAAFQEKIRKQVRQANIEKENFVIVTNHEAYQKKQFMTLREIDSTRKFENQIHETLKNREIQKHREFLDSILERQYQFKMFHNNARGGLAKIGSSVVKLFQQKENEAKKKEIMQEKERMRLLMEDNEDEYRKLVKERKDTRLAYLLNQTDAYVSKFTELVRARKKQQKGVPVNDESFDNEEEKTLLEDDAEIDESVIEEVLADDTDGQKSYYSLAHALSEKVEKQPSILVGGTLKPYQVQGLEWMVSLHNNGLNGILADEMGLGKTIQSISLISYLYDVKSFRGKFLVGVPLSTLSNWRLEFQKWCPTLRVVCYKGKPLERKNIQSRFKYGDYDVCLTTYEYIMRDKAVLAKVRWQYLIVDEGHRIKNKEAKLTVILSEFYKIPHRILLTGTPLQNSLPELWALMNFLLPDIFNSCETFEDWFNRPFENTGEKAELNKEETVLVIRGLHKVLRPFLLRRLKSEVESQLPQKIEYIIKIGMTPLQQLVYKHIQKRLLVGGSEGAVKAKSVNNVLMQLRKVCNHPYLFSEVEDLINPGYSPGEHLYRVSGKFELLHRMFAKLKAGGHKVLVFCQMTQLMTILEEFLDWSGYRYLRLDGSTSADTRGEQLAQFNAPDSPYFAFLLSTRAGGLGLNLQSADTVIIFDSDWNPHQDLQAQDRAHRIGQKREVRVLRFVTSNSIEEYILEAAVRKLNMDAKVIQAGRFDQKTSADERRFILEDLLSKDEEEVKEDAISTLEEVNEMLARGDDEYALYEDIDKKMLAESGGMANRFIDMSEIPDMLINPEAYHQVKEKNVVETHGKGRRARSEISYDEHKADKEFFQSLKDSASSDDDDAPKKKRRQRKKNDTNNEDNDENNDNSNISHKNTTKKKRKSTGTNGRKRAKIAEDEDADGGNEIIVSLRGSSKAPATPTKAASSSRRGTPRRGKVVESDKEENEDEDEQEFKTPSKRGSKSRRTPEKKLNFISGSVVTSNSKSSAAKKKSSSSKRRSAARSNDASSNSRSPRNRNKRRKQYNEDEEVEAEEEEEEEKEEYVQKETSRRRSRSHDKKKIKDTDDDDDDNDDNNNVDGAEGEERRESSRNSRKRNTQMVDEQEEENDDSDDHETPTPTTTTKKKRSTNKRQSTGRGKSTPKNSKKRTSKKQKKPEASHEADEEADEAIYDMLESIYDSIINLKDDEDEDRALCDLFMELPDENDYPDYYEILNDFIDLDTIKERIDKKVYKSLKDMEKDVWLLCANAQHYNEEYSQVYEDATKITKCFKEKKLIFESQLKAMRN